MNLLKYSLIGIACNLAVTPGYAMDVLSTTQPPLEHVNHSRIATAKKDCARETAWAKPVRYALAGTAAAVLVYNLYKTFVPTPVTVTFNAELISQIKSMSPQERIDAKDLLAQRNYIWTMPGITNWIDSVVTSGTYYVALGALVSNAHKAISYLPTADTLSWFITARTEYNRNMTDLLRYSKLPALFQHEIQEVVQLLMLDIEKILGYLQIFAQTMKADQKPDYVITRCNRYLENLEQLTNKLIDTANTMSTSELMPATQLLQAEVNSAQDFVSANYR